MSGSQIGQGGGGLVTPQELATFLKVPVSWIYQRTRLGPEAIPFIRVGRYVRFDPQQVIAFLEAKGKGGSSGTNGVS
jgi:excisionase family DNA binding protein